MFLVLVKTDDNIENDYIDEAISLGMIIATTHIQFAISYASPFKVSKDTLKYIMDYVNIPISNILDENIEDIKKHLSNHENVLVVAHGNSIRALIKDLEGISDDDITSLEIPTGRPIIYELDDNLNVLSKTEL